MAMLLFLHCDLWSIIGDAGFVVSSLVSSASAFFSFHLLTGKMGTRPIEGSGKFLHHRPFVRLGRVQLQTKLAEAGLDKTIVYDLKRRHLFRHEEHRFASWQGLSDQIRDRL